MKLKAVAWSVIAILIFCVVGLTSLHYINAEAKSLEEIRGEEETIHPISTKTSPKEEDKLSISLKPVDEDDVKPVKRNIILDPKIEKKLQEKKRPMQGLFETSVETVTSDDKISINFTLKNISGKDQQISHGSGQQFDIWAYNEQNDEVYKWSNNKAFTQALIARELNKSGQLTFNEEWNLKDNEGNPVPAGKYTIEVRVMIGLESGTISPDELVAKSYIEID